jgi:hypothetical protein
MAADVVVEHPNRETAAARTTRAIVVGLVLVAAALMIVVSAGGWDAIEGAKAMQVALIVAYVGMAVLVARWNRGVLPVAAGLAVLVAIFAAVAALGWYARDTDGFVDPALPSDVLGLLTALLVPLQALLVAVALRGFQQRWNVEVERPVDGAAAAA